MESALEVEGMSAPVKEWEDVKEDVSDPGGNGAVEGKSTLLERSLKYRKKGQCHSTTSRENLRRKGPRRNPGNLVGWCVSYFEPLGGNIGRWAQRSGASLLWKR